MAGMKITLSEIRGLTVNENGARLLTAPLIFQCGPMDELAITRQFVMGNYDTVYDGQFTRRGSKQLKVWTFDTLAVAVGATSYVDYSPSWVSYPTFQPGAFRQKSGIAVVDPSWYAQQLATLSEAGCPFRFTASTPVLWQNGVAVGASVIPVINVPAVFLQYNEGYKAGENDAIYFEQMSFSEWRDPSISQKGLGKGTGGSGNSGKPRGTAHLPTVVNYYAPGGVRLSNNQQLPPPKVDQFKQPITLGQLAKQFYGDPADWRVIARANSLHGCSANTPLGDIPRIKAESQGNKIGAPGVPIKIPAQPNKPQTQTSTPAYTPRSTSDGGAGL